MQGLLFKSEMTLANLREINPKSRTSRVKGLQKINENPGEWTLVSVFEIFKDNGLGMCTKAQFSKKKLNFDGHDLFMATCPYGKVGDTLYGKETYDLLMNTQKTAIEKVIYKADYPKEALEDESCDFGPWRSPMMMPERASRYHIILEKIIAQRIQEITPEDCIKEGIDIDNSVSPLFMINTFSGLWDSINGSTYPWSMKAWVWVLYYRVVKKEGR